MPTKNEPFRAAHFSAAAVLIGAALIATLPTQALHAAGSGEGDAMVGDAAAGLAKAAVCNACHGTDGKSIQPDYPNIAGQNASYTAKQLADFKSGARQNALMAPMASPLSDQDMLDLAAYYASLEPVYGAADPATRDRGEQIWRGGVADAGIAACTGCHGPAGRGNPLAGYPALAGQNAPYTVLQMKAFRAGERNNDPAAMMRSLTHRLSDAEIDAVASYIAGLR